MPGTETAQCELAASLLDDGADGVICDAEVEWNNHQASAAIFGSMLRQRIGDDAWLAHAPFDYPEFWPHWPYEELGQFCDAVMPQVYWTEHDGQGARHHVDAVTAQWSRLRARKPRAVPSLMPIGVSYGKGSILAPKAPGAFTTGDLELFLGTLGVRCPAVSLYSYENADKSVFPYLCQPRAKTP